jgi:hypothetical protein
VADWGVYSRLHLNDAELHVLGRPLVYCHSASVSEDGRYAFLSYWDAGYITLDISDPANPTFLSRTAYEWPDEGNAHSVFPVTSRNLLLAADEDYQIGGVQVEVSSAGGLLVQAQELPFAKRACGEEPKEAELVLAGDGCASAGLPDLTGRIAALDSGRCTYYEKALAAQRAGAAGFLVAQASGTSVEAGSDSVIIPGAMITHEELNRLRNSRQIVRVRLSSPPDETWGYIRIFDIADLAAPRQIGSFATANAKRCPAKDNGLSLSEIPK